MTDEYLVEIIKKGTGSDKYFYKEFVSGHFEIWVNDHLVFDSTE